MRIAYLCPDFRLPSGGTRMIYQHVALLRERGFDACVLHHKKGLKIDWHKIDVPVASYEDGARLQRSDIIVIPEPYWQAMVAPAFRNCTRVVFAQSWDYIFFGSKPYGDWRKAGIRHVLTASTRVKKFVSWSMGLDAFLLGHYVDPRLYFFRPGSKTLQISYMPRKNTTGGALQMLAAVKKGIWSGVKWAPMLDLSLQDYARTLRKSFIYLSVGTREGENISALEAMASGCLVMGYSGGGGADYMRPKGRHANCILVENDDYFALGKAIEEVLGKRRENPLALDRIVRNGVATAAPHQRLSKLGDQLEHFYRGVAEFEREGKTDGRSHLGG